MEEDISISDQPACGAVITRIVGDQAYTRVVMRDEKGAPIDVSFWGEVPVTVCAAPEAPILHDWLSVELLLRLAEGA